jgi:hypothetical protein
MRKIIVAIALIVFAENSCAREFNDAFSDSGIGMYTGKLILPRRYAGVDGIWRDNYGKAIAEPKVNFADKYWVGLHSCEAGCRYF